MYIYVYNQLCYSFSSLTIGLTYFFEKNITLIHDQIMSVILKFLKSYRKVMILIFEIKLIIFKYIYDLCQGAVEYILTGHFINKVNNSL